MKNIITTTDLGNGNFINRYDILNLKGFVNSDRTIISLQKSVCKILPHRIYHEMQLLEKSDII